MSLRAHPKVTGLCEASVTVTVIPWVDGRRRSDGAHSRTYWCDKLRHHVGPHRCRESGEVWFEGFGDARHVGGGAYVRR